MGRIFYTADHHFCHSKVIAMSKRPFRDVRHMNGEMIRRWNDRVRPADVVYHLGDFSFGPVVEAERYFHALNGKKHLIIGNHDKPSVRDWPWESVSEMKMIEDDGRRIFLCHYPMAEWPSFYRHVPHFHGHVHGNRQVPGAVDVGVDLWGYAPVTADEALATLVEREQRRERKSVVDFGSELVREVAARADSWMVGWEREHLANAIDEAAMRALDDLLQDRVDRSGGSR
ncbi:metallophosphoesterase [Jiella sp. M17.18]|uniref:metallophosphoesterase n=1 Tax=Jiella sp. M17.18 TaxID=3234247 RepID=UPI0034DFFB82